MRRLDHAAECKTLIEQGWSVRKIALHLRCSKVHVVNQLLLADAPYQVREMIAMEIISPSAALKAIRTHGEKAVDCIVQGMSAAAAQGKRRIPPRLIVAARTAGDTDPKCATCEAVRQLRQEQALQQLAAALQQGQENAEQATSSEQRTTQAENAKVEADETPLATQNVLLPPAPEAASEPSSDECAEHADGQACLDSIDIEDFLMHPHWERMDDELHRLVEHVPQTSQRCERTTILSWLYQREGVSTFTMLADRVRGIESPIMRKRAMRRTLRTMERLNLVSVITFAESNELTDKQLEELGRNSMITLTWTGMVWMRRAWQARANLARNQRSILQAHEMLVAEEEEGRGDEPIWVEGLAGSTPEEAKTSVRAITIGRGHITSVFDLGMKR